MRVRYTRTALVELEEIFAFIAKDNVAAASSVAERIEHSIAQLAEFPYLAQTADEEGVRRLTVRRLPYVVYYTVDRSEVVILHIWHGARKSPWNVET